MNAISAKLCDAKTASSGRAHNPAAPDLLDFAFAVDLDKAEGSSFAIVTRVADFLRDSGRSVLVDDFFSKRRRADRTNSF